MSDIKSILSQPIFFERNRVYRIYHGGKPFKEEHFYHHFFLQSAPTGVPLSTHAPRGTLRKLFPDS